MGIIRTALITFQRLVCFVFMGRMCDRAMQTVLVVERAYFASSRG